MSGSHSPSHVASRHGRHFEGSRLSIQVRLATVARSETSHPFFSGPRTPLPPCGASSAALRHPRAPAATALAAPAAVMTASATTATGPIGVTATASVKGMVIRTSAADAARLLCAAGATTGSTAGDRDREREPVRERERLPEREREAELDRDRAGSPPAQDDRRKDLAATDGEATTPPY